LQNVRVVRDGWSKSWLLGGAALLAALGAACSSPEGEKKPAPAAAAATNAKPPLRIAYSDWPGWTALEIGIQKGWFKEAGVDVQFSWFDYLPSMDAYTAGKVDAVTITNGDALVMGANGAKSKLILLMDYSNGNDQVIGQPSIKTFKDLKGKKVGLEVGLVDHLLFLRALEKFGMKASDVEIVKIPTNETPQALASGQVSAIAAWYPVSAQAHKAVANSTTLFTSADVPGLIYDTLAVNPASLESRREDWAKVVKVWYRISDFVRDPKTQGEAVAIMAAKVGVKPEEYQANVPGTHFLSLEEAKKAYRDGDGLYSVFGSSRTSDQFNVTNSVYKDAQKVEEYVYPDFVLAM
jgi:NitT/TauT family transport system substrate-binding protein